MTKEFYGDGGYLNDKEHFEEATFENGIDSVDLEINQRIGEPLSV